jgi:hypothetical protein
VSQETSVPVSSGTEPSAATPPDVAGAVEAGMLKKLTRRGK